MRTLTIIAILAFPFLSLAQGQDEAHRRTRSLDAEMAKIQQYRTQIQEKEQMLADLVEGYLDEAGAKSFAEKRAIEQVLYELFDLNLLRKEADARLLSRQLSQIEEAEIDPEKAEEIQQLKFRLEKVKLSLDFR
ncbi:MAG: hypothetical protein AAFR61_32835, partial [Bacteroidota bacterium]